MWGSIGIATAQMPTLPNEVDLMTVDGRPLGSVYMTLHVRPGSIKANSIDNLNLVLLGEAQGTAVTWSCVGTTGATITGQAGLGTKTTITDPIAIKYFNCP
jgi:hypothetical protein